MSLTEVRTVVIMVVALTVLTGCGGAVKNTPAPFSDDVQQRLSLCLNTDDLLISNKKVFSGISAGNGYLAQAGIQTDAQFKTLESSDLHSLIIVSLACKEHATGLLSEKEYENVISDALAPEAAFESENA